MRLTLADIDRWDPRAITTVFEAAIKRAHGTRVASAALSETLRLLVFNGVTAEAAHTATQHTGLMLDDHADACEAVGRAAEQAAGEVAGIKSRLQGIRDAARTCHLAIDDATGAVTPPPNLSSYSILDTAAKLTDDIQRLLGDAECADEDLAAAIRGADGDLSPEQVTAQLSHQPPTMPKLPARDAAPEAVNRWWHALTPAQQDRVEEWFGESIRNLDGIPATVRNELNLPVLQRELTRLQNGWLDANGVWRTDTDKLADLQALQRTLAAHPGTSLFLLDTTSNPRKALAALGVGDVDNAERVGVTVGGLNTRVSSSVEEMVRQAEAQRGKASDLRRYAGIPNYDAVTSIAWLGYDAPSGAKSVAHDWLAHDGAGPLNSFYKGLAASTNASDQHITAFGHSYGSLTTSLALQQGAPVDDVVLYGSPGAEISDAAQLGVKPGHAYYLVGVNDHIADIIPSAGVLGPGLQDVPGMTELSVNTGQAPGGPFGDERLHELAYGHSEYARMGDNDQLRMSGYNMAAVLAGLPEDLIKPPKLPPATIPSGPGPFGLPIPNPDYHP